MTFHSDLVGCCVPVGRDEQRAKVSPGQDFVKIPDTKD
jgi:hypothetical protein